MNLREIPKKLVPKDAPPVPRGFKVFLNEDNGSILTSAGEGKKHFYLAQAPGFKPTLVWAHVDDFPTQPVREAFIATGLKLEITLPGARMTNKAPKCTTILRREYGMKGTPISLYMQFCKFRGIAIDKELAQKFLENGGK